MTQEGHHRESYYIDTFISGLKEELSQTLYNNRPATLQEARNMARGHEHLLGVSDKSYKSSTSKTYTSNFHFKPGYSAIKGFTIYSSGKNLETKRLTLDELNDKKKRAFIFIVMKSLNQGMIAGRIFFFSF